MNIIGNAVNIVLHYILLHHLHFDVRAAPISITCAYASIVITAIIYMRISRIYEETWHPITYACLQDWTMFLKLALPGVLSVV